ncbi:MAG: hypothetical protein NTY76_04385, partial [Candidatus Omnitrophica bacterium]|nr:hypothetical protein [Candidatus Omnitrophota bacterium]
GTEGTVKLELTDSLGNKSDIYLTGVSSTAMQYYAVNVSSILGNANLAQVKNVTVVVEGDNKIGNLAIDYMKNSSTIPPDPTKSLINVNIPATDIFVPSPMMINPSSATGTMVRTDHGMAITGYNTSSGVNGGWIGSDLNYTLAQNLSGTTIVMGVQGTEGTLRFEITDASGNKSSIYLTGVSSSSMQYYSIDLSKLSGNANLSSVKDIAVIVEGDNKTGNIAINYTPKTITTANDPTKTGGDVNIPINSLTDPAPGVFKPTAVIGTLTLTTYGFAINNYDTKSGVNGGWIGANLGYATSTDLTGKTLIIGVKGTEGTVKLELTDSLGNKSDIYLTGVSSTAMQYYAVNVSSILGNANLATGRCKSSVSKSLFPRNHKIPWYQQRDCKRRRYAIWP